jgi:hypothetical protein
MIFGMNVFEFCLYFWLSVTAIAWCSDYAYELGQNTVVHIQRMKFWNDCVVSRFSKKKHDPELTVEIPVGSFDPDETMKLALFKHKDGVDSGKTEVVFVFEKRHAPPGRRRHAKP